MTRENDRTITLHIYADIIQAKMMQDKLNEKCIDSFLNDENVLGMDPVAGVELKIFEKDKKSSRRNSRRINSSSRFCTTPGKFSL